MKKNKKILFLETPPYDVDFNTYNIQEVGLGKAFCRLGYDYDFITFKKRNQKEWIFYEYEGCIARYIEMPRTRILRMGINLSLCDKEFLSQYDIIISREYYQIMTYLMSKKSNRVSMYSGPYYNMFMFSFDSYIYDAFLTKKINRQIPHKFVKSVLAEEFLAKKGYTGLHNVGVGLDTERFDQEEVIESETQRLMDYMKKHKCMLYVGTLCDRKNYPFMLNVYQEVLKTHSEVKFVVIGKSKQSAFAKLLGKKDESYEEDCIANLPLEVKKGIYRIEKLNNPQLKFIYPLTKAFILPSKLEIFGMVLLEAMYLGAPVVTSKNGGSLTLMGDGKCGQIVEEFSTEKWAEAVIKYLEHEDYVEETIREAHNRVKYQYNWDVIAKKFLNVIEGDE